MNHLARSRADSRFAVRWLQLCLLALVCWACGTAALLAADPVCESDIWLVDSRHAPGDTLCQTSPHCLRFYQRVGCQWNLVDRAAFLAGQQEARPTAYWIHGNNTTAEQAQELGLMLNKQLQKVSCCRPFRLVIWSWPSEHELTRPRNDLELKAGRSDVQALYLAQLLQEQPPTNSVCLLGYSYGARTAAGALHLLGGGSLSGKRVEGTPAEERSVRTAVLMAGAFERAWLQPGQRLGLALDQLDGLLVAVNDEDPILNHFGWLYRDRSREALGNHGLISTTGRAAQIRQIKVSQWIGRTHASTPYIETLSFERQMLPYVFPDSTKW